MPKEKKIKLEPTKWRTIEIEYGHLLLDNIQNGTFGSQSERNRDITTIKKTIKFIFGGKMYCTEVIKAGYIDYFHYDLYDDNGSELMKFHSEPHPQKECQTETEPFHLHVRENPGDNVAKKRIANHNYRTVMDIMHFIEHGRHISPLFQK